MAPGNPNQRPVNQLPQQPSFAAPLTNPFNLTDEGSFSSPSFADLDGDGDLDAFVGQLSGDTFFYQNTGSASSASFAVPLTNPFNLTDVGNESSPSFVDINADGDLDAFVGERNGDTFFYQNTGSASSASFAAPLTNPFNLTNEGSYSSPSFADLDGDGDLDAFVGEQNGNTYFYQNQSQTFSVAEDSALVFSSSTGNPITISDVDAGSNPVQVTLSATNGTLSLNGIAGLTFTTGSGTNNSTLVFTGTTSAINTALDGLTFQPTADFNGNASFTLTTNDQSSEGALSDTDTVNITVTPVNDAPVNRLPQQPSFSAPQIDPFGLTDVGYDSNPSFGDVDGDGDLDALLGGRNGNTLFYQNTGSASSARFAAPQTNPFGLTNVGARNNPTLVDVDGDRDLDALVGAGGNTLFYQNTGSASSARFAAPQTNPFNLTNVGDSSSPSFADIDADGDLDALVGESEGNTLFYQNTGSANSASFAAPQTNPFGLTDVGRYSTPTFEDVDGDGDLDAFVGEGNASTLFYQNTGSASSAQFAAPLINPFGLTELSYLSSPSFVDIDGDGDLDALVGEAFGNTYFYQNQSQPRTFAVAEDSALVFSTSTGNPITISDFDAGSNPLEVTLSATNGTLSLNGIVGLSFTTGSGTNNSTLVFTGTTSAINTALNGLTFQPTADFNGNASFTLTTHDQSSEGALSDTDTVNITVTPAPPTVTNIDDSDADDQVTVGIPLDYTLTFSEDINVTTVSTADFDNAGTAAITFGAINEPSPGTLTVQVTPTSSGTLQLRLPNTAAIQDASGSALVLPVLDDTTLTVTSITTGNGNANALTGTSEADLLQGFGGNDQLNGRAGDDTLVGGLGRDIMQGGSGSDIFRYDSLTDSLVSAPDRIIDFNQALGDRFELQTGSPVGVFNVGSVSAANLSAAVTAAYAVDTNLVTAAIQPLAVNQGLFLSWNNRIYLGINNGTAAFSATDDLVVEVAGSLNLGGVVSVPLSKYFTSSNPVF